MNLSQEEAAAALQKIDTAGVKSRQLYSYRISGTTLLLWGALLIVMGLVSDFSPEDGGLISLIVWTIGLLATFWIVYRRQRTAQKTDPDAARRSTVRQISLAAVSVTFIVLSQLLLGPTSAAQGFAYGALFLGALCAGFGIWQGVRYIVAGGALVVAALSIYWLHLPHAVALISLAGGTAMIASGFWMRKV